MIALREPQPEADGDLTSSRKWCLGEIAKASSAGRASTNS